MVGSLGNQQYTVKMDGSGRASLRNRQFLRKIEPYLPRYIAFDKVLSTQQVCHRVQTSEDLTEDQIDDETVEVDQQRKSSRVRNPPDRYGA